MPSVTRNLIIANVIGFFLIRSIDWPVIAPFALWPVGSGLFMPWQIVSYAFLHAGLTHLMFNMFGLWMFGSDLERVWGGKRFVIFYFVAVLAAALAQLVVTAATGANYPTIGASGGLFGLLVGFAVLFPNRKVIPLIPPIPMPAPVFVTIYGLLELTLGVTGSQSGVAHFAHLGGLVGGWLTIRYWRRQSPFGGFKR